MKNVLQQLKLREKKLLSLIKEKKLDLKSAPSGFLRINSSGGRTNYYVRDNPKDFNGKYIPAKDLYVARRLAQRDYDKKVLRSAEQELNIIQRFLNEYPDTAPEFIYGDLHDARKSLVSPIRKTDEQYLHEWLDIIWTRKEIPPDAPSFLTEKGEQVRSKSEVIIADILYKQNIPYRYEYPLFLNNFGMVHPDFTIMTFPDRKELYWEHLGMMDDQVYVERNVKKINAYIQNGLFPGEHLILTFETKKTPLNQNIISQNIQKYLL